VAVLQLKGNVAVAAITHQVATILAGVLAGAVVAVLLTELALGGDAELWIGYHQAITTTYTVALPLIGVLSLVAAVVTLVCLWQHLRVRWLLLFAIWCLLVGMVVTAAVHLPLNAEVLSWQPDAPPDDWDGLRLRWLQAHGVRTLAALAAFAVMVRASFPRHGVVDENLRDEPSRVRGSE
jgi:hypothetical protein